jgi:hypothetical protein
MTAIQKEYISDCSLKISNAEKILRRIRIRIRIFPKGQKYLSEKYGSSRGLCLEHVIPAGEVLGEHVVEDDILEILQLIDVPLQGGQPLQPGQAPLQLFYLVLFNIWC